MKQFNAVKKFLLVSFIGASSIVNGQTAHPLHFGNLSGTAGNPSNWYKDYVGVRFEVVYPAAVAGEKIHTTSNNSSGATGVWGAPDTTRIINMPLARPQGADSVGSDSLAGSAITVDMTGKVALIYRGGGIEFGFKALQAQNAHAVACIIVNNVGGGPVGMGAGSSGGSVTIPVYMISKADGDALWQQFNESVIPRVTIVPWSSGLTNDLGFVSQGISQFHAGAMPAKQFMSSTGVLPYLGIDGAFVANYGTATQTHVKLKGVSTFTPTGGSATTLNTDSITLGSSFPQADSIWAMYCPQYDFSSHITGPGQISVNYSISSDSVDQFAPDNSVTYTVDVTSALYCKGRYDFTNNKPYSTTYTGPGGGNPYIWGPAYYVAHGGDTAYSVQFSPLTSNTAGLIFVLPSTPINIYLMKWVDGADLTGGLVARDSLWQNGELMLEGLAVKNFNGTTDSSFQTFNVAIGDSNGNPASIVLQDTSWYYVGAEMPSSSSVSWSLGCDGVNNCFPRTYGRAKFNNYIEYSTPLIGGDRPSFILPNPADGISYTLFSSISFIRSATDSSTFTNQKGLIPNIALLTSNTLHNAAVKNVKTAFEEFNLYPNPATNSITVSLGLDNASKEVVYTILNNMGQVVSAETRYNVTNDKYTYNTAKLASGNYYMIVNANGKAMYKKFTVIKQ